MRSSSAVASALFGAPGAAPAGALAACAGASAGASAAAWPGAAPTIQIGSPLTFDASSGSCAFGPNALTMASIALTLRETRARTFSSESSTEPLASVASSSATSASANRV